MIYKVLAPGRVNLIGEHTDYNEGFVLPIAIDLYLEVICKPVIGRNITARADNFDQSETFSLDNLKIVTGTPTWIDYIKGVCWVIQKAGYRLSGADLLVCSNIPIGSGLSSSAAIELAVARALTYANGSDLPTDELALLCQKAENEFVGVHCGIMDQYAIALGQKNKALLLDCRSLDYSYIPLRLGSHRLLIIDSRVKRQLGASAYNQRREECEDALLRLSTVCKKDFKALRDVTLADLKKARPLLPDQLYCRSRYVIEENIRVKEAAAALQNEDLMSFGYFMKRSHAGLRDLYEVSSPELDLIVDTAMSVEGVLGARMTGAGFGGCAVALLEAEAINAVREKTEIAFTEMGWQKPSFYSTSAAEGIQLKELS